jgi:hypothetical protein
VYVEGSRQSCSHVALPLTRTSSEGRCRRTTISEREQAAGVHLGTQEFPPPTPHAPSSPPPPTAPPHSHNAAPVTGHAPRLLAPFALAQIPRCAVTPRPRPATMRIHPILAVGQHGRVQQEDSKGSRSGFGQGKDGRTWSKGTACSREGAGGV